MERRQVRWTERFSQFAVAGARLALEDANLSLADGREDVGVYIGSRTRRSRIRRYAA